ncbi:MAG: hypothetical protein JWO13_2088 [Acidobacteriales bacterium]|nr:hypothetical protein [Terriglobales bacterium]
MSISGYLTRKLTVPFLRAVIGRKNLVLFGRVLTMESRLDSDNHISGNGELLVQDTMLQHSPPGAVMVFDVGAHLGVWTLALLNRTKRSGLVLHSFEPASATFTILNGNVGVRENVTFVNQALSDSVGTAQFYVAGAGVGTNSLHPASIEVATTEQVKLNTVDHYCREQGISRIDLLKIDAEGHDFAVIAGAREMLKSKTISMLQFEYNHRWIDSRHYLKDAFDMLLPLGYKIGKITSKGIEFYPGWHFELESFREGNYLACLDEWCARFPQIEWWNLE